jgi:branched-chain amino acid transport system permease protein
MGLLKKDIRSATSIGRLNSVDTDLDKMVDGFEVPEQKPMFQFSGSASLWQKIGLGLLLIIGIIAPIVFQGFGHLFMIRIFAVVGLYILLALGLNIVVGYAGMLDFGRIAFYAVGAYVAMWVGVPVARLLGENLGGLSYFIALPAGGLVACLVGLLLGLPVMRLRGDYLTVVTLGFGEIVRICLNNNIFGLTNGAAGLPRAGETLATPVGLNWLKHNTYFTIGNEFEFTFTSNVYWYFIIFVLIVLSVIVIRNLDNSRLGRSWAAVREDEVAAQAMGVNVAKAKMYAFVIGAFFGGIAGVTFSYFQVFVSPESFTFLESALVLSIVVIGGMGSIPGVLIGALAIQGIPEFIRGFASAGWFGNLPGEVVSAISNYRYLVFGALMVFMMAVRPQGLIPSKRKARELLSSGDDAVRASSNLEEMRDEVGETSYTQL